MENRELVDMIENYDCNLVRVKSLVGLLWDIHAHNVGSLKEWDLNEKYRTSQTLIDTLFNLLIYQEEESKKNIDKIYQK